MIFFLIFILLIELYLVNRILNYFILSPVYLYIIYSLVCIILTIGYYYFFEDKFSLFELDYVSKTDFIHTIQLYIIALCSFLAGVLIYYDLSKKQIRQLFNKPFSEKLFVGYKTPNAFKYISICLLIFLFLLYLVTYGKGIFIRKEYIPEQNKGLITIIKILSIIQALLLGLIYNKNKIISIILFTLFILLSVGTGSRTVFIFFVLYVLIIFITKGNNLMNKVRFSTHIAFSLFFLAYIMQLRSLNSHGIIPYIKSLWTLNNEFYRSFFFNIYYSFIYGVFVTIRTVKEAELDWHIIWVNINPLPGNLAGWYDYANKMRINLYVPYSLHGRVFKTGLIFTILYFFSSGLIFSYFEKKIRKFLDENKRVISFMLFVIIGLHIVYAFEYNMRSAIRYYYYGLFVIFMSYLFKEFIKNLPKKN